MKQNTLAIMVSVGLVLVAVSAGAVLAQAPAGGRQGQGQRGQAAAGREVTYSRDVAPILNAQCVSCHRPGEVAPFSLMSYREARPWARSIKSQVQSRQMPPWGADPHYGEFSNSRRLTDAEVATIIAWVDAGAPEGNPTDLPKPPQFTEGWRIGTPDLVVTMKAPATIPASGTIPWTVYDTDHVFAEDTWVQAIEVRPGNRRVVHHAVAQARMPREDGSAPAQSVHLYSPGLDPIVWREGYGKFFPKGTRITIEMHYNAVGTEQTDQTKVGFKFARAAVHTEVKTTIITNNTFSIPPMVQRHEIVGALQFPAESRIHALRPHMHIRGKSATGSLITPDGNRRVLVYVPKWDDAWQNYYVLSKPARVQKGSILEYVGDYDNSTANPLNPDPKVPVVWGEQTWEEMHAIYMTWTEINDKNKNDDEPIQISPERLVTGTR